MKSSTELKLAKTYIIASILFVVIAIIFGIIHAINGKESTPNISKFNYEGHTYLKVNDGYGVTGITHDANCSCHLTSQNE